VSQINLEDVKKELKSGKAIEEIVDAFNWKEFENFVAEIFVANGFFVKKNLRFKTKKRHEIDVLAVTNEIAFAVDCKEWGKGRYKSSSLKTAVIEQEKRVKHLKNFLKNNSIARKTLKIDKQEILSVVVTWLQEDLQKHNSSFIIPVWKLNNFLVDVELYL